MKKIYLAIMAVAALMATSCSDFLDVHPKGEKVEDDLFDSSKGFEDAIYGVYGAMASNSVYGMEMVWGIPELLCQNFECKSTSGKDFSKYDYTTNSATRDRLKNVWTKSYEAIGYANNVIQNLEKKSPDAFPLYNMYKGEMLAARAMLHFDLLRLFAPTDPSKRGIPYVKTYNFSVKPFSTVGECEQFIINDLTEAEGLMKDGETMVYPRNNAEYDRFNCWRENHLNLYAVQALLARVYWYVGNNAKAAEYAEAVINSKRFPLVDVTEVQNYLAGVLSPKETIFGLYSTQYMEFAKSYLYDFESYKTYEPYDDISGSSHLLPWTALYQLDVDATMQDYRKTHFRQGSYGKCLKMVDYLTIENTKGENPRADLLSGISLIHSSEMYLIAADALLESNYTKALEYFNAEINSRGLPSLRPNETLTATRIFNEYHKEMFCEGQHWFNMKRLNADIQSNAETRVIPGNDDIYVLPIPQEEFDYRTDETK